MKLRIEDLAVDSFEVSPVERGGGTVRAHLYGQADDEVGIETTDAPATEAACPTAAPTGCTCLTVCNDSCDLCSAQTCALTVCTCVHECVGRTDAAER